MNDLFDYICDSVHKIVYHMTNTVILSALRQNCKSIVTDTVNEMYDNITDHCIFLIYYVLYRECAEKKSVRYYIAQEMGLAVEREFKEYDETLYAYKTFRKAEDEQMKNFFKDVPELADGIYKQFSQPEKGKSVERTEGQKLSLQAFLELLYMKKYSIIRLVTKKNFSNTKNLSHMKFEDEYLPQIISRNSGIYRDILSDINIQTNQIFIRCINLFALEANCHFERNYLISKALSSVCLNKEQKNAEKEAFAHINVFNDGEHKYQDYLVKGYADILPLYNYTAVDAKDIYDISHLCNYIINTVTNMFFNVNKNEYFTLEMSKEAEKFFDNFIGNGQHINEKSLSEFKTKDFRELYK